MLCKTLATHSFFRLGIVGRFENASEARTQRPKSSAQNFNKLRLLDLATYLVKPATQESRKLEMVNPEL